MIKNYSKFIPIFVLLFIYLMLLLQSISVALEKNNGIFIILAVLTPIPLFIGMSFAIIKLRKQ